MQSSLVNSVPGSDGYVLFRLAEQLYGVPTAQVAQLIPVPPLRAVPESPATDRGVFMLRDRCVLVLDLRPLVGLPSIAGVPCPRPPYSDDC